MSDSTPQEDPNKVTLSLTPENPTRNFHSLVWHLFKLFILHVYCIITNGNVWGFWFWLDYFLVFWMVIKHPLFISSLAEGTEGSWCLPNIC